MKTLKDNAVIISIMTLINAVILIHFISVGQIKHGIGYFFFFYISITAIYFFTKKIPALNSIVVKNPRKELLVSIVFAISGACFLFLNLYMKKGNSNPGNLLKLPVLFGVMLFTFPVGLFIYLLLKKYKIIQLGIYIKPLINILPGVIIFSITGLMAFLFNKNGIHWDSVYTELGGIPGLILQGVIGAALAEEFLRFVLQTRFECIIKTKGMHILLATILWAFMHFPVTYFNGKNFYDTTVYCFQIIPIGFVWGYLTDRTKSIIPSVIAHGFNLWGIQNG